MRGLPPAPGTKSLADWLLRVAAPLVPHDLRRDWLREWRAELAHMSRRAERAGRVSSASCALRAAGAIPHAAWLRWDRWRVEMIWQDLKHAARTLLSKPAFTVVTLATLALGIGGNAAIFGVVHAVLLRPLPFPEPDRLVQVFKTTVQQPDRIGGTATPPDFTDWRRDNRVFSELSAHVEGSYALTGSGPAQQVPGAEVTGGFFAVLGIPAFAGRYHRHGRRSRRRPRRRRAEPRAMEAPVRRRSVAHRPDPADRRRHARSRRRDARRVPVSAPVRALDPAPLHGQGPDDPARRALPGRARAAAARRVDSKRRAARCARLPLRWRPRSPRRIATPRRRSSRCVTRWCATRGRRCSYCSPPWAWCC